MKNFTNFNKTFIRSRYLKIIKIKISITKIKGITIR